MGAQDFQLMFGDESTYATPVTVDRTYGYTSEDISEDWGRTESDILRRGSAFPRDDVFTPYFKGAAGNVEMPVRTKGFGFFLEHMLGQVATTGPAETSVYTHTGTEADILGKSLTCQVNRPFNPAGTDQAFTYAGGKITEWTLSNAAEGDLMLQLALDFAAQATATALASASYDDDEPMSWVGGVVSIGGTDVDLDDITITHNAGLNVDRRKIRGNAQKKEPKQGRRGGTFAIKADFESLAQRARVASATAAGAIAEIVATWEGPTLLGTSIYPTLEVTLQGRFDTWKTATGSYDALQQEIGGIVVFDDTNSPIKLVYKSADSTP